MTIMMATTMIDKLPAVLPTVVIFNTQSLAKWSVVLWAASVLWASSVVWASSVL